MGEQPQQIPTDGRHQGLLRRMVESPSGEAAEPPEVFEMTERRLAPLPPDLHERSELGRAHPLSVLADQFFCQRRQENAQRAEVKLPSFFSITSSALER
jgi:hypothetical protein